MTTPEDDSLEAGREGAAPARAQKPNHALSVMASVREPDKEQFEESKQTPEDIARVSRERFWTSTNPGGGTWAEVLSTEPLIIHTWRCHGFPVGAASVIGPHLRDRKAHFLLSPVDSVELPFQRLTWSTAMRSYLADHPLHRLSFLGNTDRETRNMAAAGFDGLTVNHNCLLDERPFHPLPGVKPIYDAVYNARLSPEKRVELAAETERVALLYFHDRFHETVAQFHAGHARLKAQMPHATFVNKLTPEGCEFMNWKQVNAVLAQARVGLCLSHKEGAMKASIEYMLAGLAVVSTPSFGGREHYFDNEYCLIADADPRSIRDAVREMVRRDIPRDYIRAKTLARIEADRAAYIAYVQGLIDEGGGRESFADRFWKFTYGTCIHRWRLMSEFLPEVMAALPPARPSPGNQ